MRTIFVFVFIGFFPRVAGANFYACYERIAKVMGDKMSEIDESGEAINFKEPQYIKKNGIEISNNTEYLKYCSLFTGKTERNGKSDRKPHPEVLTKDDKKGCQKSSQYGFLNTKLGFIAVKAQMHPSCKDTDSEGSTYGLCVGWKESIERDAEKSEFYTFGKRNGATINELSKEEIFGNLQTRQNVFDRKYDFLRKDKSPLKCQYQDFYADVKRSGGGVIITPGNYKADEQELKRSLKCVDPNQQVAIPAVPAAQPRESYSDNQVAVGSGILSKLFLGVFARARVWVRSQLAEMGYVDVNRVPADSSSGSGSDSDGGTSTQRDQNQTQTDELMVKKVSPGGESETIPAVVDPTPPPPVAESEYVLNHKCDYSGKSRKSATEPNYGCNRELYNVLINRVRDAFALLGKDNKALCEVISKCEADLVAYSVPGSRENSASNFFKNLAYRFAVDNGKRCDQDGPVVGAPAAPAKALPVRSAK